MILFFLFLNSTINIFKSYLGSFHFYNAIFFTYIYIYIYIYIQIKEMYVR